VPGKIRPRRDSHGINREFHSAKRPTPRTIISV
jgi:hypothetical protein